MIKVEYAPKFLRQLSKLEKNLQEEAVQKIELFKNINNHKTLEVHKLRGRFRKRFSFSVTNKVRILFKYQNDESVALLAIDDHDIYKKK